jgi:hypothetical protein
MRMVVAVAAASKGATAVAFSRLLKLEFPAAFVLIRGHAESSLYSA